MSSSGKNNHLSLELAELVKQLNNAMDIAHLGMYEWDTLTDKVRFDKRAYEITGIDPNNFSHTMDAVLDQIVHPDSLEAFKNSIELAREKNIIPNRAYRLKHPYRKVCWIKFMSRIIREEGRVIKLIGVMMDVTAQVVNTQQLKDDSEFIATLIENIPSPIFYKDARGIYRRFNKAFEDFLGLQTEDIKDKSVYDVAPKELAEIYEAADNELIAEKGKQVYESTVQTSDGETKHVVFRKSVFQDDEGEVLGLIGLIQDVTDLRKAELTLRKISEAQKIMMDFNHQLIDYKEEKKFLHDIMIRFMPLLEKATTAGLMKIEEDGVMYLYDSHELSLKNKKLSMTYEDSFLHLVVNGDYGRVHMVGELHIDQLQPDDVGREIMDQNLVQSIVLIPITHLEKLRWFFVYGSDQLNGFSEEEIKITDFIRTEMDALIKMYLYFQQTLMMAHYDSVTDLMNRAYFDKRLQAHIQKHRDEKFYVVLIDLDGLKQINDVLGHDAGDRYLKLLGHLLLLHCAPNSFWGRIGGDEYAGVVYGTDYQELVKKLESVQLMYRMKLYKESKEVFSLDFSYGISHYPEDGQAYKELLKAADKLMYAYKNTHKHKKGR
jgi:diguanylate cyclase (GGDEF)-like protein/PAS domain S-box-containing protein